MLEKCRSAKERWGGVSELIDRWLQERQDLLGRFVALPQLPVDGNVVGKITGFCDILVDYVSSWHFGVYEHLLAEADQFNDGSIELARKLEPSLNETTDSILSFNDEYADLQQLTVQDLQHMSERLSLLGEKLAERFEYEDQLIGSMHTAHKDRV